jgi:hypothetical protein
MTTRNLNDWMDSTVERWADEAELNFARRGAAGEKMHRSLWANGQVMVGFEGARSNQYVPLARAIEIFRNGWKIYA